MTEKEIAKALLDINAVNFTINNPVTFRSGIKAPIYVDNRKLIYHPKKWETIIQGFKYTIKKQDLKFDIAAGIATGAVPHSSVLAYTLKKPSVYVRKKTKEHGAGKRVEGGEVNGKKILLIEDLVTMGTSSLPGIDILREEGAQITDCLIIVSYGFKEAKLGFEQKNVNLHPLTSFETILDEALERGQLNNKQRNTIKEWLKDPHSWTQHMI